MRLLIVEDEAELLQQLQRRFQNEGFGVDTAADGEEGLYIAREYPVNVAIVDIGLPKLSGIELLQQLRAAGKTFPVLILTARGRWQDKVDGLDAGADDYLVKPFHIEELVARVKALLRRAAGLSRPEVEYGPIRLNTSTQQVILNNTELDLTAYEYKVLEYLMLNAGKVLSKAELTEHIYAQDFDRDSNVIEVFVGRLRRKLDPDNVLQPIETLRGRGYRFTLEQT
ncbi:two-component system response regulator [Candidatus Tenderia electrophaga]|jgi:two-component system response regulator PhoP|uniref:Two-component system response regulator n=1 Tax=Candidatus Tenderia electrophaga TaxID=1748243 RepID=A0A0S2TBS4_9GAMM|nr:two-component system response regulator [Candidatus Tenderia electrophaga]